MYTFAKIGRAFAQVVRLVAAAVLAVGSLSVQATPLPLQDLGDGTVWDPNTHLIWLKDWNANGLHDWTTQHNWAEGLIFAGASDWHLPTADGFSSSAAANQYLTLPNVFGDLTSSILTNGQTNPFTNVQPFFYWSGTEFSAGNSAWEFYPGVGGQGVNVENEPFYAVAVRSGDPDVVPEPPALALMLLALGAAGMARRWQPV